MALTRCTGAGILGILAAAPLRPNNRVVLIWYTSFPDIQMLEFSDLLVSGVVLTQCTGPSILGILATAPKRTNIRVVL